MRRLCRRWLGAHVLRVQALTGTGVAPGLGGAEEATSAESRDSWLRAAWRELCSTRLGRLLVTSGILGGGITVALIGVQHLSALPVFITSWASSCALILSAPRSRAARPSIIVIAHMMCGGVGFVVGSFIPHTPSSIAVSIVLSVFLMLHFRVMHPPAAANPVIALTTAAPHGPLMVGWIGGSLCLAALALFMQMTGDEGDPPD